MPLLPYPTPRDSTCKHGRKHYYGILCAECKKDAESRELTRIFNKKREDIPEESIVTDTYKLLSCPDCHKASLFIDRHNENRECFNRLCPSNSLTKWLTDELLHSD